MSTFQPSTPETVPVRDAWATWGAHLPEGSAIVVLRTQMDGFVEAARVVCSPDLAAHAPSGGYVATGSTDPVRLLATLGPLPERYGQPYEVGHVIPDGAKEPTLTSLPPGSAIRDCEGRMVERQDWSSWADGFQTRLSWEETERDEGIGFYLPATVVRIGPAGAPASPSPAPCAPSSEHARLAIEMVDTIGAVLDEVVGEGAGYSITDSIRSLAAERDDLRDEVERLTRERDELQESLVGLIGRTASAVRGAGQGGSRGPVTA